MSGVLVDRELLKEAKLIAECFASSRHATASMQKNPAVKAALLEEMERAEQLEGKLRAALARPVPAQAAADAAGLTAEVWVHDNEHAELLSVTGHVRAHIWEDLQTDLAENSPELPEGAYTVPVDKDDTDPTGMASGAYTYYLDWDAAKRVELCTSCARSVLVDEVVSVVMDDSASVPMCPKCAAHDARLRALADALEVQG